MLEFEFEDDDEEEEDDAAARGGDGGVGTLRIRAAASFLAADDDDEAAEGRDGIGGGSGGGKEGSARKKVQKGRYRDGGPQYEVMPYPAEYCPPPGPGLAPTAKGGPSSASASASDAAGFPSSTSSSSSSSPSSLSTSDLWRQVRHGTRGASGGGGGGGAGGGGGESSRSAAGGRWRCVAETRLLLADTSRELSWKASMASEVRSLARLCSSSGVGSTSLKWQLVIVRHDSVCVSVTR